MTYSFPLLSHISPSPGLRRAQRQTSLLLCGLLSVCATALYAAEPIDLTFAGQDYSLISSGAGTKNVRISAAPRTGSLPGGTICVEVRGFGSNSVDTERRLLDKAEAPLLPEMTLPVALPQLGLYELSITATDQAGNLLASGTTTYAAIPERTGEAPEDFGVATHFGFTAVRDNLSQIPRLLDLITAAGFSWIRDEVAWSTVEREKGVFTFGTNHDTFVTEAAARDLNVLLIFDYGNGAVYPEEFKGSQGFPETPGARAAFTRYAQELVKRYGSKVKYWEVWNEPHAWGKPTIANYTLLLNEVSSAVKALDPQAYIIGCGGGGAGGGPGGDYAGGVINNGGLEAMDGFSIHPYISPPGSPDYGYPATGSPIGPRVNIPDVWQHLGRFIRNPKNTKADGTQLELWVTEFGAYSSPVAWVKGEAFQAAYLTRAYLLSRRYAQARALFWYNFYDKGTNPYSFEDNFGLIRQDYSAKPAYVAAAVLSHTLGNKPWKRSYVDDSNIKIFEYGEGTERVIAGWNVQQLTGEFINIRPTPGTYILRDWQGQEKEVVIGDKGYRWNLRPIPQYLIPKN